MVAVSGSIAAYKAAELASILVQSGAVLDVLLTAAAQKFIGPATFAGITHRPPVTDLWGHQSEIAMDHVAIGKHADLIVIAPATANTIAKIALGVADDAIGATCLASDAPILFAPAMDGGMFESRSVQRNVEILKSSGARFAGPVEGRLASGEYGLGRMLAPDRIIQHASAALSAYGDMKRLNVVVTAGGTREPIDLVRYIANASSGKMGFAIAEAARDRGAKTILVTGPSSLDEPELVETVKVETTQEMFDAVMPLARSADILVCAAAPADFRPAEPQHRKIKRLSDDLSPIGLHLNPDIAGSAKGPNLVKVVFAAETSQDVREAARKAAEKRAKFCVLNDITDPESSFGTSTSKALFVDKDGSVEEQPLMAKRDLADRIFDRIIGDSDFQQNRREAIK